MIAKVGLFIFVCLAFCYVLASAQVLGIDISAENIKVCFSVNLLVLYYDLLSNRNRSLQWFSPELDTPIQSSSEKRFSFMIAPFLYDCYAFDMIIML